MKLKKLPRNPSPRHVWNEINPQLEQVAIEAMAEMRREERSAIFARYHLGRRVILVNTDTARYGPDALEPLATHLRVTEAWLLDCVRVASNLTLDEVEALIERVHNFGKSISFDMVLKFANIKASASVDQLLLLERISRARSHAPPAAA